jgi:hypothetical protein
MGNENQPRRVGHRGQRRVPMILRGDAYQSRRRCELNLSKKLAQSGKHPPSLCYSRQSVKQIESRAMTQTTVPKKYWGLALGEISLCACDSRVSIAVSGEEIGGIREAKPVHICGISYDPMGDTLAFDAENLTRQITNPKRIDLTHEGVTISVLTITAADNRRHVLNFCPPLALGTNS